VDVEASQRLLDFRAIADGYEAIHQGLEDMLHGRTHQFREVFDELRSRYRIPR